ncbi:MAG TPA: endonuclease V [Acidobacteriota bacterium]|nr:endonuclease V [Acidobacteriota bacterium]
MELSYQHPWPATKPEAYAHQDQATRTVLIQEDTEEPSLIAAVDTAYGYASRFIYAAAVVMTFPDLQEIERSYAQMPVSFPYYPGLFYFREGPVIIRALADLDTDADLILVSAHGIAHPRRCGMACHIGIAFDKPTIGCARRLLAGHQKPVDTARGAWQPITFRGSEVGVVYRSKDNVKPIFVSPGHRCDITFAREIVVRCLRGFRLPEPLRVAHLLANKHKHYNETDRHHRQPQEIEQL